MPPSPSRRPTRRLPPALTLAIAGIAAVAACQPIAAPLPRGARPPMLIEVHAGSAPVAATLRTFASGLAPSREVPTDLGDGPAAAWLSWDIDLNGSDDLIRLRPDGSTLRLDAAQVWPPTGGVLVNTNTALPSDDLARRRFVAIDGDGDGLVDVAALHSDGTSTTVQVAPAAGGFTPLTAPVALPIGAPGERWWATALDANRDCRSDLAVASVAPDGVVLTVLDGASGFTTVVARARPAVEATRLVGLVSSDDDLGGPPLLWLTQDQPSSMVALNADDGYAAPRLTVAVRDPRPGSTLVGPANPPLGGGVETIPLAGRAEMVDVGRGIVVHRCLAAPMRALLAEASDAGFAFTGAGWRSSAEQAVLRRRHCGRAAATAPTEACRPPTAPVGTSMHERGLAVDLRLGGRTIAARSSPAYRWLRDNAARFGLRNYPPEPWHWSTNGE